MDRSIRLFKSKQIPVFEPGEEDYERSVATANMLFRFSRPDCVVQPETPAHVQAIVKQAKARGQKITIKCGGHSYAGHSTAFQGISLDLRRMNNVQLDMRSRIATIGAGCQWGDVYKTLVNGKHDGFIINGGRCPFVGVGGYTLGGGLGPFTRSFGMGCDTLREATVVTADGALVTVKDTDDPSSDAGRLFWALCGAGGGNYGVVVQMKLAVLRLRNKSGTVVAGRYTWFPQSEESRRNFMKTMDAFYATDWPREMTIDTTWLCDLRDTTTTTTSNSNKRGAAIGVRFIIYYDGEADEYQRLIAKHIKDAELAKQLRRRILPEKSTRFLHETLVQQWSEETTKAFPTNRSYTVYSSFSFPPADENSSGGDASAISSATAILAEEMAAFGRLFAAEAVSFLATWIHAGGRAADRDPAATAFPWRRAAFQTYVTVEWNDKWMERDMRGFLGRVKKRLRPLSLAGQAAFVNFPDGLLDPRGGYERAYYGGNVGELRKVKAIWDGDGFWNGEQGVRLARDVKKGEEEEGKWGVGKGGLVDVEDDEGATDSIARKQWEFYEPADVAQELADLADFVF